MTSREIFCGLNYNLTRYYQINKHQILNLLQPRHPTPSSSVNRVIRQPRLPEPQL